MNYTYKEQKEQKEHDHLKAGVTYTAKIRRLGSHTMNRPIIIHVLIGLYDPTLL